MSAAHSTPTRRSVLTGALAIGFSTGAVATSSLASPGVTTRSDVDDRVWQAALDAYHRAERASDVHYETVETPAAASRRASTDEEWSAIVAESNRLNDAMVEAEDRLFEVAAPHLAAVVVKLDLLFKDGDRDPCPDYQALVLADVKRLAA